MRREYHLASAKALGITEEQRRNACLLLLYLRKHQRRLEKNDLFEMQYYGRYHHGAAGSQWCLARTLRVLGENKGRHPCGSSACLLGTAVEVVPPSSSLRSWLDEMGESALDMGTTADWHKYAVEAFGVDLDAVEDLTDGDGRPYDTISGRVYSFLFGAYHSDSVRGAQERLAYWLCGCLGTPEDTGDDDSPELDIVGKDFRIPWAEAEEAVKTQ